MVSSHHTRRGVIVLGGAMFGAMAVPAPRHGPYAATIDDPAAFERFMGFSVEATGFSADELKDTAQGQVYYGTVRDVLGSDKLSGMLAAYGTSGINDVLHSDEHGPVARNIIKLWYSAAWEQMPDAWQQRHGRLPNRASFIVSDDAYQVGLLWPAIGANPPGADAPGFGTWSSPPARS